MLQHTKYIHAEKQKNPFLAQQICSRQRCIRAGFPSFSSTYSCMTDASSHVSVLLVSLPSSHYLEVATYLVVIRALNQNFFPIGSFQPETVF